MQREDPCRAIAEQINQDRPQWLITWGCYTRRFWAYPLFDMHPPQTRVGRLPAALLARLDEAEHRSRIPPHQQEMTSDDPASR
ncbi:MAG: hypothetical protein ACRDNF_19710 [Streptosporangiaceae bacterium]